MSNIDEKKLDRLHKYLQDDKTNQTTAAILKEFGFKDVAEMTGYSAALAKKYPDKYDEPEPATVSQGGAQQKETPVVPKTFVVILTGEDGIGRELEITGTKENRIYVKQKVPTELVTVKIAGKDETVDLIKLRKMKPTDQHLGVSVQTLLVMAAIAKG